MPTGKVVLGNGVCLQNVGLLEPPCVVVSFTVSAVYCVSVNSPRRVLDGEMDAEDGGTTVL